MTTQGLAEPAGFRDCPVAQAEVRRDAVTDTDEPAVPLRFHDERMHQTRCRKLRPRSKRAWPPNVAQEKQIRVRYRAAFEALAQIPAARTPVRATATAQRWWSWRQSRGQGPHRGPTAQTLTVMERGL